MLVTYLLLALVSAAPGLRFSFSNDDDELGFDDIPVDPVPVPKPLNPSKPPKRWGWFSPPVSVPLPVSAPVPGPVPSTPAVQSDQIPTSGTAGSFSTTNSAGSDSPTDIITAVPVSPAFSAINPNIETPISATEFLNSLPVAFQNTSRSDLVTNTTFCWKRSSTRPFSLSKPCPPGSDIPKGFGICYPVCPNNAFGFGPSCWSKCPPSLPFSCGASCTTTRSDCMSSVFTQISSISEVVYNLAAALSPKSGMSTKPLAQFTNAATQTLVRTALTRVLAPKLGDTTGAVVDNLVDSTFSGKKVDWGGFDPAGIKVVVDSFYRPLCPVV